MNVTSRHWTKLSTGQKCAVAAATIQGLLRGMQAAGLHRGFEPSNPTQTQEWLPAPKSSLRRQRKFTLERTNTVVLQEGLAVPSWPMQYGVVLHGPVTDIVPPRASVYQGSAQMKTVQASCKEVHRTLVFK